MPEVTILADATRTPEHDQCHGSNRYLRRIGTGGDIQCPACRRRMPVSDEDADGVYTLAFVPAHDSPLPAGSLQRAALYGVRNFVLAYQYEADRFCVACSATRFGVAEDGEVVGTDAEGNAVSAVYEADEWYSDPDEDDTLICGQCLMTLAVHSAVSPRCDCGDGCPDGDCPACTDDYTSDEDDGYEGRDEHETTPERHCVCDDCLESDNYVVEARAFIAAGGRA